MAGNTVEPDEIEISFDIDSLVFSLQASGTQAGGSRQGILIRQQQIVHTFALSASIKGELPKHSVLCCCYSSFLQIKDLILVAKKNS